MMGVWWPWGYVLVTVVYAKISKFSKSMAQIK